MFFVRMDEPETNSMTFAPPFRVFAPRRRTHRQPPFQWDAALLGEYSLLKQQKKHRVFHTFTENPALLAPLTRPNTDPEEYRQNQT